MSRATWLLAALPLLGLLLFATGTFAPLPEAWWDRKGFVVNLGSGLTAACFGVPLAFFVLQGLLKSRDYRELRTSFLRASDEIRATVDGGVIAQPYLMDARDLVSEVEPALLRLAARLGEPERRLSEPPRYEEPTGQRVGRPLVPPPIPTSAVIEIDPRESDFIMKDGDCALLCWGINDLMKKVMDGGCNNGVHGNSLHIARLQWERLLVEVLPRFVPFGVEPLSISTRMRVSRQLRSKNPFDALSRWFFEYRDRESNLGELGVSQHRETLYVRMEVKPVVEGSRRLEAAAQVRKLAVRVKELDGLLVDCLGFVQTIECAFLEGKS